MRAITTLAFGLLGCALSVISAAEVFEVKMNVKSDQFGLHAFNEIPVKSHQPIQAVRVNFVDEYSSKGRYIWSLTNGTGKALTNLQFATYADVELEEATNTFFNESASVIALTAPQNTSNRAGYLQYTPKTWMVDEPGYDSGQLSKKFDTQQLSNQSLLAQADDVAVAFTHLVPKLESGKTAYVELHIGDAAVQGIKQTDTASNTAIYLNSIALAPQIITKVNRPPVANNDAYTTKQDTSITLTPLANDSDPDKDKIRLHKLNNVVVLGKAQTIKVSNGEIRISTTGALTFVPSKGFVGKTQIAYEIADPSQLTAKAMIDITVSALPPVNRPPVAQADRYSTQHNTSVELRPLDNDRDPDGDSIRLTKINQQVLIGKAQSLTLPDATLNITANGQLNFIPNQGFSGSVVLPYEISDSKGLTATSTITVNVANQVVNNRPPVAVDDRYTVEHDQSVVLSPLSNDSDPDGDQITLFTLNGQPLSGDITLAHGRIETQTLRFTPNKGFSGDVRVGYEIKDSKGLTANAFITIAVKAKSNQPPVAVDDAYSTKINTAVTLTPLANDRDPENQPLKLMQIDGQAIDLTNPQTIAVTNGEVRVSANALEFMPSKDYEGKAMFSYQIEDDKGLTASAKVVVNVSKTAPKNLPPVAVDDAYSTKVNTAVTLTPLANDSDPENQPLKLTQIDSQAIDLTNPQTIAVTDGEVRVSANALEFMPSKDYEGEAMFSYQIADDKGLTASAKVVVNVSKTAPKNQPPVAVDV